MRANSGRPGEQRHEQNSAKPRAAMKPSKLARIWFLMHRTVLSSVARRVRLAALVALIGSAQAMMSTNAGAAPPPKVAPAPTAAIMTGAAKLVGSDFAAIAGRRVGLVTNHTARVDGAHLADVLADAPNVTLAAILAPEHGFRGAAEAGASVDDGRDSRTGVPIFSLYGATKKPTQRMLRNLDVLVFDIQDIGARFYTYISTMGLAMQAAAEAGIPFVVLDRPNPLGGTDVSGFVLEKPLASFVGQYPIPIVHGMTVGELARMIKGERMLPGLDRLDLVVIEMTGWQRGMRWPDTGQTWIATSPNIPSFASALVYPGIGVVGELAVNEGRGTPEPFTVFGARWFDGRLAADRLNALALPGVRFEGVSYTPRSIPGVATNPRFLGQKISGVRLDVTDVDRFAPLETGMHAIAEVYRQAPTRERAALFPNVAMFHAIAGTRRLMAMIKAGKSGAEIVAAWQPEVSDFKLRRAPYLIY